MAGRSLRLIRRDENVKLLQVSMPIFIAMLTSAMADAIIQSLMGRFGSEDLAAYQWVSTYKILQTAAAAPTGALYSLLSGKLAEAAWARNLNDEDNYQSNFKQGFQLAQQGFYYAVYSSLIVSGIFYFSGASLRRVFHQDSEIADRAHRFLRWY